MIALLAYSLLFSLLPSAPIIEPDVVYDTQDGIELKMDIYRPAAAAMPTGAVVVIHGGAWMGGKRPALIVENTALCLGAYALMGLDGMYGGMPMLLLVDHRGSYGVGGGYWYFGGGQMAPVILDGLKQLKFRGHEVIALHVLDPAERTFPVRGHVRFEGIEVDQRVFVEPHRIRDAYLRVLEAHLHALRQGCSRGGIDYQLADTSEPIDELLLTYMARRQKRRRVAK